MSGVGGVGKTTLAFKYVCRYAESYPDGVFYFNAESYPSVQLWLKENVSAVMARGYYLLFGICKTGVILMPFF